MKLVNISGIVILFVANLIGKIFGAVYRIPLSNLLGAEGIGLYQMAFPVYSFLLTFVTSGISITLTRKIAKLRANNNMQAINNCYVAGKRFSISAGIILTIAIIIFAYPLAFIQGNINAFWGYIIIAFGFLFACNLSHKRGYFQGYGNMAPTAVSQIIEQITKLVFGLILCNVFISFGLVWGVVGALLGVVLGEIFANVYFKLTFKDKFTTKKLININNKSFIKECLPVGINYTLLPLSSLIDSMLVINLLKITGINASKATGLYGIYSGMILPLINMPNVLISAIALSSIPHISYCLEKKENVEKKINNIFRFSFMFILPCVVGIFLLSNEILSIVYPTLSDNQLGIAIKLLQYSSIEMFFLCFLSVTNSIMQAIEKTKQSIMSILIGFLVKVFAMIILIPNVKVGILGVVISNIIAYCVPCFINLNTIKNETKLRVSFKNLIMPIIAISFMFIFIKTVQVITLNFSLISLAVTVIVSGIIYLTFLLIVKQWTLKDVKNLLHNK